MILGHYGKSWWRDTKRIPSIACALLLLLAWSAPVNAQEINLTPEYFISSNFKLVSGEILPEIRIEYAVLGKAKVDPRGNITNAVVLCHGFGGNYAQVKMLKDVVGPGKPLDTDKYFFICPTALGSPGSSSPAVSGLGLKFPVYTFSDIVKSQYLLVTEHFKIRHLLGVAGVSMGGYQTLQWITQYPDFMDWAIPIAASASHKGARSAIFAVASHIIRSDSAYRGDGSYKEQPRKGMESAFMSLYFWYFTPAYFQAKIRNEEELQKELQRAGAGATYADANDTLRRIQAMALYDTSKELQKIKARTLVIGVNDDKLFPPAEDFIPLSQAIPGAKLFAYDSPLGHMGSIMDLKKAKQAIADFLK